MNAQQLKFAEEYRKDNNATQAAIRAGYSPRSAHVQGCRLLRHERIRDLVNGGQTTDGPTETTPEQIISDLKGIARSAKAAGAYGASIKAKELIGRHIGMWPARMELTGPNGGPVQLAPVPFDASALSAEKRQQLRDLLMEARGQAKLDAPREAQRVVATVEAMAKPLTKDQRYQWLAAAHGIMVIMEYLTP